MKNLFIATLLLISFLSLKANEILASKYLLNNQTFEYRALNESELTEPIIAWATNYFIPEYDDGSGDIPMRNMEGIELGPKLSLHDWCHSALEGSVKINLADGTSKVFNYFSNTPEFPVDCSPILSMDLSKTKFKISKSTFGEGTASFLLIPYRSLATDHAKFPAGTVLYIPEARSNKIKIGDTFIEHDGYFIVSDRGGAIKDNHIDVFTGIHHNPTFFKWIGHKPENTFNVFIVHDQTIINSLTNLHLKK